MARVRDTYLGVLAMCVLLAISPFVFSACGRVHKGEIERLKEVQSAH